MKKAQIEILGLMIIMVLIALGVLFAVKYVFTPGSEVKKEFQKKNIAENMLDVMLDTEVECNDNYISIQDLLIDCNKWQGGSIHCNGELSCEYVIKKINNIFKNTLDKWGNQYNFKINDEIKLKNEECKGSKKIGIQPLPYDLVIKLEICD